MAARRVPRSKCATTTRSSSTPATTIVRPSWNVSGIAGCRPRADSLSEPADAGRLDHGRSTVTRFLQRWGDISRRASWWVALSLGGVIALATQPLTVESLLRETSLLQFSYAD